MMKYKDLILDFINLMIGYLPIVNAYFWTYHLGVLFYEMQLLGLYIFMAPLVLCLSYIASLFIVRLCLPKLRPGEFPLGLNKGFLAWVCHRGLYRSLEMSMLKSMIYNFNILKHLLFKALGADIAFGANIALDAQLYDYPLLKVGKGVTIGAKCMLSCHYFSANRLVLKEVIVDDDVLLALNVTVAPGSVIKKKAVVGPSNVVSEDIVPEGKRILPYEWQNASPKNLEKLVALKEKRDQAEAHLH